MNFNIKKYFFILFSVLLITIIFHYFYNNYVRKSTKNIETFEDPKSDNSTPIKTKDNIVSTEKYQSNNENSNGGEDDLDKIVGSLKESATIINQNTKNFVDYVNKLGIYVNKLVKEEKFTEKISIENDDNADDEQDEKENSENFEGNKDNDNDDNNDQEENKDNQIETFTQNKIEKSNNNYSIQGYDSYLYDGYYMKL